LIVSLRSAPGGGGPSLITITPSSSVEIVISPPMADAQRKRGKVIIINNKIFLILTSSD
jgi:hypothetical protein